VPERIRRAATTEMLADAEERLGRALPENMRQLYLLADGFAAGAYLLRDDYRVLPLGEMVQVSLALMGQPVVLDELAGAVSVLKQVTRFVFVRAKDEDPDVEQVSLRLRTKRRPSVELWYRAGWIHDFDEDVDREESVTEWIEGCLVYYRC
jgi:cell wall assembly regulator SMI1